MALQGLGLGGVGESRQPHANAGVCYSESVSGEDDESGKEEDLQYKWEEVSEKEGMQEVGAGVLPPPCPLAPPPPSSPPNPPGQPADEVDEMVALLHKLSSAPLGSQSGPLQARFGAQCHTQGGERATDEKEGSQEDSDDDVMPWPPGKMRKVPCCCSPAP